MTRKRSRPYTLGARFVVDDATRAQWAERLRAAREKRGITQAALADQLGCTRQALSAWERGINVPSLEARRAIAAALGRRVTSLFPEPVAA
jgi:putative transcriptional regulator